MLGLALRTLRLRKGGFVATFLAAYLGAVLMAACGGLAETSLRADAPPQRLAAAPVVVTGKQTFEIARSGPSDDKQRTRGVTLSERSLLDRGLAEKIRAVDGVRSVVPDVSFPATFREADMVGHGWRSAGLTPYTLREGRAPRSGEVVLDASVTHGLRPGDTVRLAVRGAFEQFRVAGIAAPSSGHPDASAAFFSDADVSRLYGHPGRVDAFAVSTEGDPDAIRQALGDSVTVLTGDSRGDAEFPQQVATARKLSTLFFVSGGVAMAIAVFVVANTLVLSLQQRQRELALLRTIGATPGQVRRMVLGEAMTVGVLAIAAAVATGQLLGRTAFGRLVDAGVVDDVIRYHQGVLPMAAAAAGTVVTVVGAAFLAARRATRVKPTEALQESAGTRPWFSFSRLAIAVLCFAGGTVLAILTLTVVTGPSAAGTAGPAVLLWAVGVAMMSPAVVGAAEFLLRTPVRVVTRVPGWLALVNTRTSAVRVAGAVTPIMLAVGVTTANVYLQTTQNAVSQQVYTDDLLADAVVASPTGISPGLVRQIERTEGVARASGYVTSSVFVMSPFLAGQKGTGTPALGLSAAAATELTASPVVEGSLRRLTGKSVALPENLADELNRKVGDSVTVRLGDGSDVTARIVATLHQREGYEQLVLPSSLLAQHTTPGMVRQVLVRAAPGLSSDELLTRVRTALKESPVTVEDREALVAAHADSNELTAWVNYLIIAMVAGYTVIAVANTLVMSTARRRREFGLQQLVGVTRGQVLRMAGTEGLLVAVIGVLTGTAVAAGTTVPFTLATTDSVLPTGPVAVYGAAVLGSVGLAFLSVTIPAWFATRPRPVEAVAIND